MNNALAKLRKIVCVVFTTIIILTLSSCTSWENAAYVEYTCPEGVTLLNPNTVGECESLLKFLGYSEKDVLNALSDGQMLFTSFVTGIAEDGSNEYTTEMFMNFDSTDYTKNIFNFSRLTETQLNKEVQQLRDSALAGTDNGYSFNSIESVTINDVIYVRYDYSLTKGEEKRYALQYTTFYNGFSYSIIAVDDNELDENTLALFEQLVSSIRFTRTLEPSEPYDDEFGLFSHSITRFFKNNWLEIIIVAALTIGITITALVVHEKNKKNPKMKKNDGVVRADYLK